MMIDKEKMQYWCALWENTRPEEGIVIETQ